MEWFDCETNNENGMNHLLRTSSARIQQACGQRIVFIVQAVTSLTVSIVLSMSYSWKMGLVTIIFTPLSLLLLRYNNKLQLRKNVYTSIYLNRTKEVRIFYLFLAKRKRGLSSLSPKNQSYKIFFINSDNCGDSNKRKMHRSIESGECISRKIPRRVTKARDTKSKRRIVCPHLRNVCRVTSNSLRGFHVLRRSYAQKRWNWNWKSVQVRFIGFQS